MRDLKTAWKDTQNDDSFSADVDAALHSDGRNDHGNDNAPVRQKPVAPPHLSRLPFDNPHFKIL